MTNKQNKRLKTVKLPLRNDTYSFQYSTEVDHRPVISENWNQEVAQFFMEIYPNLLEEGNSISDLQQRASFEAITKSTPINSIDDFLQMVSKLKINKD